MGWTRPPAVGRSVDRREVVIAVTIEAGDDAGARSRTRRAADSAANWLARNRARITQGRDIAHVLMPVAPPPVRVPLIAVSLAAEGLILADDYRQRRVSPREAGWRSVGVVLDGVGLAAVSSAAPRALARHARGIATARAAYARLDQLRRRGA